MKKRSGFSVMAQLIGLVKPLAGFMVLAIVMGLIGHLCATFITVFGALAVGKVLGLVSGISYGGLFVAVVLFALVRGLLRYAEQACNHFIAFKLLALIREKVFCALRKLCPAKLEGRDKGDLISVITSDIELLEVFYAHTISPVAIALLFCLVMCLFIGHYSPILGLIALGAYGCVGIAIPILTSKASGETGLRLRNLSGELSAFVLDSLRGLSEIQQYGQGQQRLAQMNDRTDRLSGYDQRLKHTSGRNQAVTNTVILLFDLAILFTSALLYRQDKLDFLGVLVPTIALMSSFGPTVALANLGSTLQNTFAAGNRVLDILEETPVVEEVTGKPEIDFQGASAEHITFAYDNQTILDDLSLTIPQGAVVGIVGRSGSGKSTLLKLFMRFWKVGSGRIAISGTTIDRINTENLRSMESFVTQDTYLFHDSIKNNLRIAKLDATDEQLEEACKKASVHGFILSLPQGYDTPVGELGDTLSGGERQRIGLARAFLHQADLLLLDEPTSNLDSLNEAVILKALKEEKENRTMVLVSHRASTMRIADTCYCVEHGRIS